MTTAESFPMPAGSDSELATIRLFQPGEPPPKTKPERTLEAAFAKLVKPKMLQRSRKPGTIRDIERALEKWREYWTAQMKTDTRISDPCVLSNVKVRHMERWQTHLLKELQLSPPTVNRYLGSIRQVLVAAESRGIVKRRPKVERLPTHAAKKFYLTIEQVESLWSAAGAATWPQCPGMSPGDWWRCALVLYWVYGFRTQELIAFQTGKQSLCWSAISLEAETPNPEGTARNALGWLVYTPQKQSWAKPQPLYLPLIPATRAAIDRLRAAAVHRDGELVAGARIFPLGTAHKSLYRQWRAWQTRAKVATKAGTPFLLKSLRKSAATYLEKHRKGLGAAVCGWADREISQVMQTHYAVNELELVDELATYPTPECFKKLGVGSTQLELDF
jgi:integrase